MLRYLCGVAETRLEPTFALRASADESGALGSGTA